MAVGRNSIGERAVQTDECLICGKPISCFRLFTREGKSYLAVHHGTEFEEVRGVEIKRWQLPE